MSILVPMESESPSLLSPIFEFSSLLTTFPQRLSPPTPIHIHPNRQVDRHRKKKKANKARSQPWQHPNRRMLKDHNMAVGLAQAISKEIKHLLSKWSVTSAERTQLFFSFLFFLLLLTLSPMSVLWWIPHPPHSHIHCQHLKAVYGTKTKFMT